MPRGSPFTALCQLTASLSRPVVADLHTHTLISDGDYTTSQVVALARQSRMQALAITDHDALDAVADAIGCAVGTPLTIVPGVECSAEFRGRELHVLGYGVRLDDGAFNAHLRDVQARRRERFDSALAALRSNGAAIPEEVVAAVTRGAVSFGRRHLAGVLLKAGAVANRHEAFAVHLRPLSIPPIHLTEVGELIGRIHAAGGVAALAHPPREFGRAEFAELQSVGLDGVEVQCPSTLGERSREYARLAKELGLLATGGTDTHGPPPAWAEKPRTVGSVGLAFPDWAKLRERIAL